MVQEPAAHQPLTEAALVIGLVPYGESNLIVRVFTKERGRMTLFARGAKKSKKRFPGGISRLCLGQIRWKTRSQEALPELLETDFSVGFQGLANDPRNYGRAAYVVELLDRLLPVGEPAPDLFADAITLLHLLANGAADARHLRAMELRILKDTGYLPNLVVDPTKNGSRIEAYDPLDGVFLTQKNHVSLPFSDAARDAALGLLQSPLKDPPEIDELLLRTVSRIFAAHLRKMDIGPLKSIAFLKEISHQDPS
jgi:recombinational DNA repair protein (RecF pathway)